jgi:hypothetical protein
MYVVNVPNSCHELAETCYLSGKFVYLVVVLYFGQGTCRKVFSKPVPVQIWFG